MQNQNATFRYLAAPFVLIVMTLLATVAPAQTQGTNNTPALVTVKEKSGSETTAGTDSVTLIDRDYLAPYRSLKPAGRIGVDAGAPTPLTLNDAIKLALENNNDITASRIDVEMASMT